MMNELIKEIFIGKRKIILFVAIFFLSFLLKISYIHLTHNWSGGGASDTRDLMVASDAILSGEIMKDDYDLAYYPGFPLFLSGMRLIFGDQIIKETMFMRFFCVGMYALICTLGVFLCYILFGEIYAFFTIPFIIISPAMTFWSHFVLTESLFTFCMIVSFVGLICFMKNYPFKWIYLLLSGFCFSFASLTRPVLFQFLAFLIPWLIIMNSNRKKGLMILIVLGVSYSMIYGFWQIRNKEASNFKTLFPLKRIKKILRDNLAVTFIHTQLIEQKQKQDFETPEGYVIHKREYRAILKKVLEEEKAFLDVYSGPWSFEKIFLISRGFYIRFCDYWTFKMLGTHQTFRDSLVVKIHVIYYLILFPCIIFSILEILSKKYYIGGSLLWLILLYFTLVFVFLTARGGGIASRYRVPIEPYMSILGSLGFVFLVGKTKLLLRKFSSQKSQ